MKLLPCEFACRALPASRLPPSRPGGGHFYGSHKLVVSLSVSVGLSRSAFPAQKTKLAAPLWRAATY